MAGPTVHSELGASGAKRWMTCPGSFSAAREAARAAARASSSIHAATGTVAHSVAERVLSGELSCAAAAEGEVHVVSGWTIAVDDAMTSAVQVYVSEVQLRTNTWCVVKHEERVTLDHWWTVRGLPPPAVELFGTADTWIYNTLTRRLTIVDYKHGAGVYVAVTDNPQLLYYAAGVLAGFAGNMKVNDVEIVVVQPRVENQPAVRSEIIDVLDLRLWIDEQLIPAVEAVFQPDAPLVPGAHCRFCAARPTCPARVQEAQSAAKSAFDPVPDYDV